LTDVWQLFMNRARIVADSANLFAGSKVLITGGMGDGGMVVTDPFCNRSDFEFGSIQSNTA